MKQVVYNFQASFYKCHWLTGFRNWNLTGIFFIFPHSALIYQLCWWKTYRSNSRNTTKVIHFSSCKYTTWRHFLTNVLSVYSGPFKIFFLLQCAICLSYFILLGIRGKREQSLITYAKEQYKSHCKVNSLLQDLEKREQRMCIMANSDSMIHKETKVNCVHKN